jgi:hypothetical protein
MTLRNKRISLYLAYCVVVIALILIVTLIFWPSHTDKVTTKQTTTAQHPAGKSAGNGANTKIASASPSKSSGSASSSTKAATTSLNNTGPGNVFGLFAAVSLVGAWFYRRKLIRTV